MVSVYQFSIIHEHKSDIAELSVCCACLLCEVACGKY